MLKKIFLSYTWSKDTEKEIAEFHDDLTKRLNDNLKNEKFEIFYDKDNITGDKTDEEIEDILGSNLDNSKALILLLSQAWLESKWCNWEYENFSKRKNKLIIPIKWANYDKRLKPYSSKTKQAVEELNCLRYIYKAIDKTMIKI